MRLTPAWATGLSAASSSCTTVAGASAWPLWPVAGGAVTNASLAPVPAESVIAAEVTPVRPVAAKLSV
ncbi:MAG: hypothetical protein IPK12_22960 [Gemmatimonadetes bacterium]|nr:hypothetical protein [Gemmatimonadota bacterium]